MQGSMFCVRLVELLQPCSSVDEIGFDLTPSRRGGRQPLEGSRVEPFGCFERLLRLAVDFFLEPPDITQELREGRVQLEGFVVQFLGADKITRCLWRVKQKSGGVPSSKTSLDVGSAGKARSKEGTMLSISGKLPFC